MTEDRLQELLKEFKYEIIQDMLKLLPDILMSLTLQANSIDAIYAKFFADNPDLAGKKLEIARIVQEIELIDGASSLEDILSRVRGHLEKFDVKIPLEQPASIEELESTLNGNI